MVDSNGLVSPCGHLIFPQKVVCLCSQCWFWRHLFYCYELFALLFWMVWQSLCISFFFKEYFIIAVIFILLERKISQCEFFPASCRATRSNCFQLSPPRETSESTDKLRILSCEEDRCLVSVIETDGCIQPAKMGHKCTLITLLKGSQCKNVQEPSLRTTYTVLSGINASALCRLFLYLISYRYNL